MLCQHSIPLPSLDKDASSCGVLSHVLASRNWRAWDCGKARPLDPWVLAGNIRTLPRPDMCRKKVIRNKQLASSVQPHLQNCRFRKYPWIVLAGRPLTGMPINQHTLSFVAVIVMIIVWSSYEPCCKLSCIVSRIEVTFTQGFEGFTWNTIGDALKNDTLKTYM